MRKLLVVLLVVVGGSLFGIDHGLISGFDLGYNLVEVIKIPGLEEIDTSDSLYVKMKLGYRVENLRIVGEYTNTLKQMDLDRFMPLQDNFRIDINYTFGDIKIGFFHFCNHPVISQNDDRDILVNRGQRALYISYYKEF